MKVTRRICSEISTTFSRYKVIRSKEKQANQLARNYSEDASSELPETRPVEFGIFFDIDGVLVRGRTVLPHTRGAFQLLTDNGAFKVPSIFCTNAGNMLRAEKAEQLSNLLHVPVSSKQVIMSHSPLKMFQHFRDKHVLVCGQGPTVQIAKYLGFKHVTSIEDFRAAFPMLDMVDHKRRKIAPCAFEHYFPKVDAVILFGEPVRWETNLQLIIDVLLTDGLPTHAPTHAPYPHIPVLACNMDLMWMSEAVMPRFAHGCFLHCLESLYQKITGFELKYTALVGKPSEITYHHSEHVLQWTARRMGLAGIKRMYCIGDNPDADIYGANLYNRYLQQKMAKLARRRQLRAGEEEPTPNAETTQDTDWARLYQASNEDIDDDDDETLSIEDVDNRHLGCQQCISILVETGVYSRQRRENSASLLDHNHRDFIMDGELVRPALTVSHVHDALVAIFEREGLPVTVKPFTDQAAP